MISPYVTYHGTCEEAFNFYVESFGGGTTEFTRLNNNPDNPIMHAKVMLAKCDGCIMGADVDHPVEISGLAICVVLPSREDIEEISVKLAKGGTLVQSFIPHPAPHEHDGGATVIDKFGFTWYLST